MSAKILNKKKKQNGTIIQVQPANTVEEDLINKKLPKELVIRIFSYLDIDTLCRCAQVSKNWNNLALDGSNWQIVDLFDFQTNVKGCVVENLSKRCAGFLKNLRLENCKWITDDAIERLTKNCKNIEILNLRECNKLTDSSCIHIGRNLSSLTTINLESCLIGDAGIKALSIGCSQLTSIDISWVNNITSQGLIEFSDKCQNLRYFVTKGINGLNNQALKVITEKHKSLNYVNIQSCTNITDDGCISIAVNCTNLKFLGISNCNALTDSLLMALGKNCHHLKILEASCCSRFTDAGFNALSKGCHLIERMDLEECNKITDLTLKYLSFNCPKLKHLNLSRCECITDEGIKLLCSSNVGNDTLQILEIDNCPLITDASLEILNGCQNLTQIELYDCQLITRNGIKKLQSKLPNVKIHAYFAPSATSRRRPSRSCNCECCIIL